MKQSLAAAAVVVFLVMGAAVLPAIAGTEEGSARRLRVALSGWENNLTPFTVSFASQPTTVDMLNLVYDTLFWSQAKRDPEPWLAEEARPSPDRRVWTVKLRSGIEWHDGRPFSAEDVGFSFAYFKHHAARSGRFGHHLADLPVFERAQVLSPTELRLYFAGPLPAFRTMPGGDLPMLPKHIWENVGNPLEATEDKPVGTGPFSVVEIVPPQRYRLRANPRYFKGKSLIDEMEISIAGDPNKSFNDLVAGKVDVVSSTVPPIFVDQLTANPDLKVVRASRMESVQLNFNARKEPFSDPKLRKALSLSIDNRVLVQTVLGGRGLPGVDGFIHPQSAWAAPNSRHEFDVAKANQILDSAGYSRKDSDGIRKGPDGKRLEFAALFSTLEPQSLQTLQLISQMTTAIGVRMEPEPAAPGELREIRRGPPGAIPRYDAYTSQLEVHTHSDPDAFYFFFHSPGKGIGAQITGYSNPAFDRLIEEAATTVGLGERKEKLNEAQSIFAEEVPALALFYPDGVYAFRPAAYDGWVPDPGHGILTKRSFLEDYATPGSASRGNTVPPAWIFLGGVAALVIAGSGLVLLRRRPAAGPLEDLERLDEQSAGVEEFPGVEAEPAEVPAGSANAPAAMREPDQAEDSDHTGPAVSEDEDAAASLAAIGAGSGTTAGSPDTQEAVPSTEGQPGSLPGQPRWPSFIDPRLPEAPEGPPGLPPSGSPADPSPPSLPPERPESAGATPSPGGFGPPPSLQQPRIEEAVAGEPRPSPPTFPPWTPPESSDGITGGESAGTQSEPEAGTDGEAQPSADAEAQPSERD